MRHICLYLSDPIFSCGRTNGRTDGLTEVFHEALADLKMINMNIMMRRRRRTFIGNNSFHSYPGLNLTKRTVTGIPD